MPWSKKRAATGDQHAGRYFEAFVAEIAEAEQNQSANAGKRDLPAVRRVHQITGVSPFDLAQIADCGDVPVNPLDLHETLDSITRFFADLRRTGATPLTVGGDHLISLPISRGLAKDVPLGMIHFDAHSDTYDNFFGSRYNHGMPFRRAIEENLVDPKRVIQIGIRGSISDKKITILPGPPGCSSCSSRSSRSAGPKRQWRRREKSLAISRSTSPSILMYSTHRLRGTGTPEFGNLRQRRTRLAVMSRHASIPLDIGVGAGLRSCLTDARVRYAETTGR